jgi:hypothetical protein
MQRCHIVRMRAAPLSWQMDEVGMHGMHGQVMHACRGDRCRQMGTQASADWAVPHACPLCGTVA